jgi:hypothetical protein
MPTVDEYPSGLSMSIPGIPAPPGFFVKPAPGDGKNIAPPDSAAFLNGLKPCVPDSVSPMGILKSY